MNCRRCGEDTLKVSHSYSTPNGKTQRLECTSCLEVHTAVWTILNTSPRRNQGAKAVADKLKAAK